MKKILTSNEASMRLARSIIQGVLGVIVANLDFLVGLSLPGEAKAIVVALVMAILSPIMAALGGESYEPKE